MLNWAETFKIGQKFLVCIGVPTRKFIDHSPGVFNSRAFNAHVYSIGCFEVPHLGYYELLKQMETLFRINFIRMTDPNKPKPPPKAKGRSPSASRNRRPIDVVASEITLDMIRSPIKMRQKLAKSSVHLEDTPPVMAVKSEIHSFLVCAPGSPKTGSLAKPAQGAAPETPKRSKFRLKFPHSTPESGRKSVGTSIPASCPRKSSAGNENTKPEHQKPGPATNENVKHEHEKPGQVEKK